MTREDYRARVMKIFEKECLKGNHSLQKIFESGSDMESSVIRWCEVCGSIVIDKDYDGRIKPGAVMGMISPSITKTFS